MFRVRIKQTDESRNTTTTLTDDGELTIALEASTTYFIDASFICSGAATPDLKYLWVYTGTITQALLIEGAKHPTVTDDTGPGDALGPAYNHNALATALRVLAGNAAASTFGGGQLRGVIVTNSAGNLKVQWAQNVSDAADVTVHAGSYIAICKQSDMDGTLIVKSSDTSRTNNTLTVDPDLQFPTVANKKYIGEMMVLWDSTSSVADYQFEFKDAQVTISATHNLNLILNANFTFGASSETSLMGQWSNASFVSAPTTVTAPTGGTNKSHKEILWSHQMGGSDSTFTYSWAQNVTNATAAIVRAPSWLWMQEVFQP